MAQPTAYNPAHEFVADEGLDPNIPGSELDIEFAALQATLDEVLTNLALIQRDDGALKNGVVSVDSLDEVLAAAFGDVASLATVEALVADAETAATAAAASETAAGASATAAAASATAAQTAEANAETAETNAELAEANAETAETNAETAAANAASSASSASTSATTATTQAANAAASAAAAQTAETNAETAETNAETAAANAAASETNAATSATNAAASYDSFDDRYLGAKAADPTLDNDGNALLTGALYWNTSSSVLKVYDGAAWQSIVLSAPTDASYLTLGTNGTLTQERVATAGTGIGFTDGGAGSTLTIAVNDAELLALAGLTSAANKAPYFTGSGTAALADFTSYGRSIVAVVDEAAFKALVNLEIGTDVQAYDADLATLAALGNWKAVYSNGSSAITALALGADATVFASNGTSSAPTFRTVDNLGGVVKAGNQTLTGGYTGTSYDIGTVTGSNQTITPTNANSNVQHCTLNGSSLTGTLTFAVPSGVGTVVVEVTNGGSGAVGATLSTSGYDEVDGATWVSTNGACFLFIAMRTQNKKYLNIVDGL